MSQLPNEELEGRLNAQRETLAFLIAHLTHLEGDSLLDALDEQSQFQDHQEDPGAVPTSAFAIEGAMMREFRLILEEARARLKEMRNGC
ncbi:hypothetical protein [Chelativorans salis]|uniref:Uncharacterized protein n=1 Tax=Chelativorans salis TaxID=2978478 RepID=A0ABT2LTR7_9HYPH|nr:hypothetical protein [Chelativorans sp. EGI FJ00035]MCT7377925.1 hypothetical protein [Chelativorans sp. EGI FJ00035]